MFRPITFDYQSAKSKNDGGLYNAIFTEDGIIWGCGITTTAGSVTFASGELVIGGRLVWMDGSTTIQITNPIQNGYARIKARIDLAKKATQTEIKQLETIVEFSTTALFPELMKEEINNTGNIYEQELAVVKIDAGNITAITRHIGNAIIDAAKLGGQLPEHYLPQTINNANGTAIKFADGTMICTRKVFAAKVTTEADGAVYTGVMSIGDFAQVFTETPVVSISIENIGGDQGIKNIGGITVRGVESVGLWRPVLHPFACTAHVTAIGRWK